MRGPAYEPRRYNRRIHSISLTNRIFLACTLLATASLAVAFTYVNARASSEAEAELRRSVTEASTLVDENRAALTDTFTRLARLVADLPKLKAAVATGDSPTVQPLADEYGTEIKADLFVLTGSNGAILAAAGSGPAALPAEVAGTPVDAAMSIFWTHPEGLLQLVSVPILLDGDPPEILGRLTVGFLLDDALAAQLKRQTGSDIAFGAGGKIVAATLPLAAREALTPMLAQRALADVTIAGEQFLGVARPLPAASLTGPPAGAGGSATPVALVLRSRTERLRFLSTIRTGLIAALVITLLLATLVSYGVARSVTRPLTAITSAMRDIAATGDLTRKVALRSGRWDDEDARLLASTFNTLTESIARFQRDAAQKDRLSSLGRLSTVIAHEIRNPLMIIKAALHSPQRDAVPDAERREAVADIEEEALRLNRIVTDVLDFAKPIQFEPAAASLNDICRASAEAAAADDPDARAHLDLDDTIPPTLLDAERLRTALVNILTNASHAVWAVRPKASAILDSGVRLTTRRVGDRAVITVADTGIGVAPEDLPHIFDPYFTTRRAGTGLGLPIARNIIDGMGGSIAISSWPGDGTQIRIELPLVLSEAPS